MQTQRIFSVPGKRLSERSSEPGVDLEQNYGSLGFEEQT